jgi:Uma2 family endonuclease
MPTPHQYTYADYLALEEASNVKHEFLDGEIYAMAGGTPTHAALSMTMGVVLHQQLRGRSCRVFSSDLRVRVLATGLATYPDVTVVCGELEVDPANRDTAVNPRVVVEVLSDSTEQYDRGVKLQHYRQIPTLGAVVLVWQHERRIEVWERDDTGTWNAQASGAGETAHVEGIGCTLVVNDVYDDALGSAG